MKKLLLLISMLLMASCATPKVTMSNIVAECNPAITQLIIIHDMAFRAVLYENCLDVQEILAIKWYKNHKSLTEQQVVALTAAYQFLEIHNNISTIHKKNIRFIQTSNIATADGKVISVYLWELVNANN
jgi:uncharacterized lipoprotein YajG